MSDEDEEKPRPPDTPTTLAAPVKPPAEYEPTAEVKDEKVKPVVVIPDTPPATPVPIKITSPSESSDVLPDDLSETSDESRKKSMMQRAKGLVFWLLLLGKRAGSKPKPKNGGMKSGAEEEGEYEGSEYEDQDTDAGADEEERTAEKVRLI